MFLIQQQYYHIHPLASQNQVQIAQQANPPSMLTALLSHRERDCIRAFTTSYVLELTELQLPYLIEIFIPTCS